MHYPHTQAKSHHPAKIQARWVVLVSRMKLTKTIPRWALAFAVGLFGSVCAFAQASQSMPPERQIYFAIEANDAERTKTLLGQGVDPHKPHYFRIAPLYMAAFRGKIDAVRAMLDAGANPNFRQKEQGNYPLLADVLNWLYRLGPAMVERGPSTKGWVDPQNWRAIAELLLQYRVEINALFDMGGVNRTYLSIAAEYNDLDMVKRLVERGADVNFPKDSNWYTPLHWAAKNGNVEMAKLFLERGADMHAKALDKHTAINEASIQSDKVAMLFLDYGANPNESNLHYFALRKKRYDLLKKLITSGVDVNTIFDNWASLKEDSDTPLGLASYQNDDVAVRILLSAGANPCKRDRAHRNAYDVARKWSRLDILKLLQQHRPEHHCAKAA